MLSDFEAGGCGGADRDGGAPQRGRAADAADRIYGGSVPRALPGLGVRPDGAFSFFVFGSGSRVSNVAWSFSHPLTRRGRSWACRPAQAGILGLNQAMDNFVQTRDNRIAPREGEAAGEAAAVQVAKL